MKGQSWGLQPPCLAPGWHCPLASASAQAQAFSVVLTWTSSQNCLRAMCSWPGWRRERGTEKNVSFSRRLILSSFSVQRDSCHQAVDSLHEKFLVFYQLEILFLFLTGQCIFLKRQFYRGKLHCVLVFVNNVAGLYLSISNCCCLLFICKIERTTPLCLTGVQWHLMNSCVAF